MLKNIPPELTPELVKFMMEMGCEDELLIAGANYSVMSRGIQRVCYVSGSVNDILNAILALYPLNESAMPATIRSYIAILGISYPASTPGRVLI